MMSENLQKVHENLTLLNEEYIELINNPKVQKVIWENNGKSVYYKVKKSIQIFRYLGFRTLIKFLRGSKEKISESYLEEKDILITTNRHRIVVYTCIFGEIDNVIEPMFCADNIDYVIITDHELNAGSRWSKYKGGTLNQLNGLSSQMKNRFCKLFPNLFFPEYELSIYIDGNIRIVSDLNYLIRRMSSSTIGIFTHPKRNDIYEEAAAVIYLNNAEPRKVQEQLRRYRKDGFPEAFGLYENSLIIRRHNDNICIKIMEEWWEQLNLYTQRDQLSLMYVIWKNGLQFDYIKSLGDNIDLCPYIRRIKHINK